MTDQNQPTESTTSKQPTDKALGAVPRYADKLQTAKCEIKEARIELLDLERQLSRKRSAIRTLEVDIQTYTLLSHPNGVRRQKGSNAKYEDLTTLPYS